METIVMVPIGALAAVFVAALALAILCVQKLSQGGICGIKRSKFNRFDERPDDWTERNAELELGDVCFQSDIEEILAEEAWGDDATGLIPPTLAILRACHKLIELLAALAMDSLTNHTTGSQLMDVAKRISPKVEDVVKSMYPPLNPLLLEARTSALVLAVTNLSLIIRHGCSPGHQNSQHLLWIDHALASMDSYLEVLRKAALALEMNRHLQQTSTDNTSI